jgi:cardiolipin-specific phospholipase
MTSLLSSLFGSSSQALAARIETMKAAEMALISFSHRFVDNPNSSSAGVLATDDTGTQHDILLFDTPIPRSDVPLKNGKESNCQLFASCKQDSTTNSSNGSTSIDSKNQLILHGVQVTRRASNHREETQNGEESPLVLLHGYMNGGLYFYRNLIGLANHCKTVYSLDMLGWGLSSRPPFEIDSNSQSTKKEHANDKHQTHATEQVFVESLEAWRKAHNIPKMTLAAHSMGGYMSVAYCEKYPQHVERLILISPAGVPDDSNHNVEKRFADAPLTTRALVGFVSSLFNRGITPAAFLRGLPESRGRKMIQRYIEGRLPAITCPDEQRVLGEYLYTNAALPASGEDCLNKVLKPTAFARKPGLHRIPLLKVKHVSFIYGQNDWMDPSGGIEVLHKVQQLRGSDSRSKSEAFTTPDIEVYGVKNAGHLLMLENWQEFNSAMIMALGRGRFLSSHAPTPHQHHNEVLEEGSKLFFHPPRWERKDSKDSQGKNGENNGGNIQTAPSM